jgi:hypothetical protein
MKLGKKCKAPRVLTSTEISRPPEPRAFDFSIIEDTRRMELVYGVFIVTEVNLWNPLPLGVCWNIFSRFPILAGARDVAIL